MRCPGCSAAYPVTPPFYQGVGYAPDNSYCFQSIPAGANSLGGPVEYNPSSNQKYVFEGSTAADFANPAMWTAYDADPPGSQPATLGVINNALNRAVTTAALGLPTCGYNQQQGQGGNQRKSQGNTQPTLQPTTAAQNISVYPNPARMMVFFQFPASGNVDIRIMDITGQLMDEQVVQNIGAASFDVRRYSPGIYVYEVITAGQTQTGKIVVE